MILRGEVEHSIVRPVPDEVIAGSRPLIRWTPVTGANNYQVEVSAVDDQYSWSGTVTEPQIKIPHNKALPPETRFRVQVHATPNHLLADEGLSSSFRTGNFTEFVVYRWKSRSRPAQYLSWFAFGALALGFLVSARSKFQA